MTPPAASIGSKSAGCAGEPSVPVRHPAVDVTMDGPYVGTRTGSANQAGQEWQALQRLTVLTVEALSDLRSAAEGLSAGEAAARLARIGRTTIAPAFVPDPRGPPPQGVDGWAQQYRFEGQEPDPRAERARQACARRESAE